MYTYILDDQGNARLTSDLFEWARWYSSVDQSVLIVEQTEIRDKRGRVLAAVDTRFSGQAENLSIPPLVWVTRLVGNEREIWRAGSLKNARSNHNRMVKMLERRYKSH